jgi:hypothetical protein
MPSVAGQRRWRGQSQDGLLQLKQIRLTPCLSGDVPTGTILVAASLAPGRPGPILVQKKTVSKPSEDPRCSVAEVIEVAVAERDDGDLPERSDPSTRRSALCHPSAPGAILIAS